MSNITGHTQLLGVFGHPISHTLSPVMHNALLQHLGIDGVYVPLHCPPAQLEQGIAGFRALSFMGGNVTVPFKEAMVYLVEELSPIAKFIGSVNTLYWKDGKLCGTSTDAFGALQNLKEHEVSTADRHVALLGNGGAARALAFALLDPNPAGHDKPASVTIFGRDQAKLDVLCTQLRDAGLGESPALAWDTLDHFTERSKDFSLLINGTSVGMAPHVDHSPVEAASLHPGLVVYDIVYNPEETRLMMEAKVNGCKTVGGLGIRKKPKGNRYRLGLLAVI